MFDKHVEEINKDIKKTEKAIIALGCSFVMGQGAVNDELYIDYKWTSKGMGYPLDIHVPDNEKSKFLKKYPNVFIKKSDNNLDFTYMEYDNAFVNVLCKKYLGGEYTPINFGSRGCGNRATIKELYFYPELRWDLMKEIVVIYCPSGLERFDFCNDQWPEHFHWKCMWPHYQDNEDNSPRKMLWEGYGKTVYSHKFEVIEQLAHVQELITWCKFKNAKLIVFPGFDRRYTRQNFEKSLKMNIKRDADQTIIPPKTFDFIHFKDHKHLANLFPWENMITIDNYNTFADLAMGQEPLLENKQDHFFQFLEKGSPNFWITPCSHPGAKAHDLFAEKLYTHIKGS